MSTRELLGSTDIGVDEIGTGILISMVAGSRIAGAARIGCFL
jgi:hypothetical protein